MSATKVKRGRKILDPDERAAFVAERRQQERERIAEAVAALATSEGWQQWLSSRSRFHTYSWRNQMLIAHQYPEASAVAGYQAWKKMGRQVRKGSKAIYILAPSSYRVRHEGEARKRPGLSTPNTVAQQVAAQRRELGESDTGTVEVRQTFRSVAVFAYEQTDGPEGTELPEMPTVPITGDELAGFLPRAEAFAAELGYTVAVESCKRDGRLGYRDPVARKVATDESLCPNARLRVLVHELAHAQGVGKAEGYTERFAELIVESVANTVCWGLGLREGLTGYGESAVYLFAYSGGNLDVLKDAAGELAQKVDELANRMEAALGAGDAWAVAA